MIQKAYLEKEEGCKFSKEPGKENCSPGMQKPQLDPARKELIMSPRQQLSPGHYTH